jgi:transcriptional regulator with XRE-family HTH domain
MAREAESVTAQRRDLGSRLTTFRKAERLTQAQLGKALHYERTSITHLEAGDQPAPRSFWVRADEKLMARGSLVAAFDELERVRTASADATVTRKHDEDVERADQWRSAGVADPVVNTAPGDPRGVLDSTIWAWQHPAAADGAVPEAGAAVLHWLLGAHRTETVARESGWRRIGAGDVRRVQAVRHRLKEMDNSLGGGAALPMAVGYLRQEVPPLLDGQYDDSTGKALIGAVAEMALDVGWMAYDAGNHPEARRQMLYAMRLAGIAGDRLFGGRAACAMSHQALHLGQLGEAVDLARAARTSTKGVAGSVASAMFSAMEACAFAAAGERQDCFAALRAAETAIQRARPGQDQPAWLDFDNGGVAGHAARAMCALGRPKEAQEFATYAITSCLPGHSRTRAQREALLATALHQEKDLEHAAAVGEQVVNDAWSLQSEHVRGEVKRLAVAMKGSRAGSVVRFVDHAQELLDARPPGHSFSTT